jgi:hypothetical protein
MSVEFRRIGTGPILIIEDAGQLAMDFFRNDASSAPGGYDDLAGTGDRDRITRADIVAINTTMRARSPHKSWELLTNAPGPVPWLVALNPTWDLVLLDEATWETQARPNVQKALTASVAPGRGLSAGTKVLHLKRPSIFPVLDSLVLHQLGVAESVDRIAVIDHLRKEGMRNLETLTAIQQLAAPRYQRSLVRIMDVLLWTSHPASGLSPELQRWEHVMRRTAS